MKVLIVDNEGEIIKEEAGIVILLANPDTFPAIKVYPEKADIKAWHKGHEKALNARERGLKIWNPHA